MHVCIVGVNHRIQWWPPPDELGSGWKRRLTDFETYLDDQCQRFNVDLLAEEFNKEMLRNSRSVRSCAKAVADNRGISHRYCDPTMDERNRDRVDSVEKRMHVWLQRILATSSQRVLFVCGDDHVEDFATLLKETGHQATPLSSHWGKGWELIN